MFLDCIAYLEVGVVPGMASGRDVSREDAARRDARQLRHGRHRHTRRWRAIRRPDGTREWLSVRYDRLDQYTNAILSRYNFLLRYATTYIG